METGIIILAAGNSSRFGSPKQLLNYEGKTLLERVSLEALKTKHRPIIVVLGAYFKEIELKHNHSDITYIVNERWENGMSSSIVKGLSAMLNLQKDIENVTIAVSDQVFITAEIFESLMQKQISSKKCIISSAYAKTIGTPSLFNKKYFEQLLSLSGANGAKKILAENMGDMATISFDKGYVDIDTIDDYNNLINNK